MKIAIPTNGKTGLDDTVAQHFGRCRTFTFLDEEGNIVEIIDNTSQHMGGRGVPPKLMKEHGANILLCKGLGPRALDLCTQLGIEVFVCEADTVKNIFTIWKSGRISKADFDDVCDEHRR